MSTYSTQRGQVVIEPIPQVVMPQPQLIVMPRLGQQMLSGELLSTKERHTLDSAATPSLFQTVRDDIARNSPVPVDRVAMRQNSHEYVGVLDSGGTPYLFALGSHGMLVRAAADAEKAWRFFDVLSDAEHTAVLAQRRSGYSVIKSVKGDVHHAGYWRHDRRTGKIQRIAAKGRAKKEEVPHENRGWLSVTTPKKAGDPKDKGIITAAMKAAPKNLGELHAAMGSYADTHYPEYVADDVAAELVQHLHDLGALTYQTPPEVEEPAEDAEDDDEDDGEFDPEEAVWETRVSHAKPPLPTAWPAKGTALFVDGKATKLPPEAEHAAYTYAKQFLMLDPLARPVDHALLTTNFERSLRAMAGLPEGRLGYKAFIARINADANVVKTKTKKPSGEPTSQTHPDLFVEHDGDDTLIIFGRIPSGAIYKGKIPPSSYGVWAPTVSESDVLLNTQKPPKGWKGGTVGDDGVGRPDKEFYATWWHPVTHKKAYLYLDRSRADMKKFSEAQVLGEHIEEIRDLVHADLSSKKTKPATMAAALAVLLIDQQHLRVGSEENAKNGTFGAASLRVEHVTITGGKVRFQFIGKKNEPWDRTIDLSKSPGALAAIKQCVAGKSGKARLWSGPGWNVTSTDVNKYLHKFGTKDVNFTAKMFRTYHANSTVSDLLGKMDAAKKQFGLSSAQMKKLYNSFKVTDDAGQKLLAMKNASGVTIQKFMGFTENPPPKGKGVSSTGLLATVASMLGHTVSSCRGSYIDPVGVTRWALKHGWDARSSKEKKVRQDLDALNPKWRAAREKAKGKEDNDE